MYGLSRSTSLAAGPVPAAGVAEQPEPPAKGRDTVKLHHILRGAEQEFRSQATARSLAIGEACIALIKAAAARRRGGIYDHARAVYWLGEAARWRRVAAVESATLYAKARQEAKWRSWQEFAISYREPLAAWEVELYC